MPMFWRDDDAERNEYRAPDDVFDLLFRLRGERLDIDHAWALYRALSEHFDAALCGRIGVHGVRLAGSGNGWIRPRGPDAALPLSKRARLIIRVHRDDRESVEAIRDRILRMGAQSVAVGASSERPLSILGTLYARAVRCAPDLPEEDFLVEVAERLAAMNIDAGKMICGKTRDIRADDETLTTRSLLVAGLKPEQSVRLQREGLGDGRELGCGLFVPHKGIDAV